MQTWRLHTALLSLCLALVLGGAPLLAGSPAPDSTTTPKPKSGPVFPDEFSDLDEDSSPSTGQWDEDVVERLERARQRYLKALALVEKKDTTKAAEEFEEAIVLLNDLASYPRIDENPDFTDLVQSVIEDYESYVQNIDNVSENTSIFILRDKMFEEVDKASTTVETIQVPLPEPPSNVPTTTIPLTYNEHVQMNITFLTTKGRKFYRNWLARSGKWFPMLKRIAKEEDMPEEIVYLAMMESGLNPTVVSRAKAVGMWQFMQPTGEEYNLDVSFWADERRDPEKATRAAMQFLKDLYNDFGDWHLALAAYNCGGGGVRRAKRKSGVEAGNFWDIRGSLPRETRDYVPLYIATALITMNREQYGFGDDSVAFLPPYEYETVTVTEPITLAAAAKCANITVDSLKSLNTELVRNCTPPGTAYKLKVPTGTSTSFQRRFTALSDDEKRPWIIHTVAKGETVASIAKRYGVTNSDIASVNSISGYKTKLRKGTTLRVPVMGSTSVPQTTLAVANTERTSSTKQEQNPESMEPRQRSQNQQPAQPTTAVSHPVSAASSDAQKIHVVTSGESLYSISRRYGARLTDIRNWNNLPYDKENIRIGDSLIVAVSQSSAPTTNRVERINVTRAVPHKVVSGESLASIATLYGTTPEKIATLNNIKKSTKLKAGRTLSVETSLSKSELASIERAAPTGKPLIHKVHKGETLGSIATTYGVSESDLKRWNGDAVQGNTVFAGTRLNVYNAQTTSKGSGNLQNGNKVPKTYIVRTGDNLSDIAGRFGVSVEKLRKNNKALRNSDVLRAGQKIRLQ